ncbi:MAG: complex I subunit 5 family protein [Defluviitaleaceae bacterium]|nr:complex I subunit 5 family protein [Defluviitaleaceae bacterium]
MTFSGSPALLLLVFWPIAGALISYIIGKKNKDWRDYFTSFVVVTTFAAMTVTAFSADNQHPPYFEWSAFMGFRMYFRLDGLRAIYGVIAAFMWMTTTLFSREYFAHYRNRNRYYFFSLITFGATLGVFFSADLITTFIFFEVMSFTSYVLVVHDEKPATLDAGKTYMAVAVIGGLALLFGIFIIAHTLQTTEIAALYGAMQNYEGDMGLIYLAAICLLVGFGGKAGMYPLHIWLPNAHPVAPAPASALLSGILTKAGIYGIIIIGTLIFYQHYGWGILMVSIGIIGMLTGAMLALFSIDLKRTLAYSSVSQIGFIVLGVGMQAILSSDYNSMAVHGTLLHMVNHSLIKLLLFMLAGVVVMNTHELNLNKIRGFGRGKPVFTLAFLMGALSIIGVPFWSGYISKTLLHESLVYHVWHFPVYTWWSTYFQITEALFTLTGGMTTAYMIKIFVCVCLEKNNYNQNKLSGFNKRYITRTSAAVLIVCALLMPALGVMPYAFMIPIATFGQEFMLLFTAPYHIGFLEWLSLRGALASITVGIIIYALVVRVCLMSKDEYGHSVYINAWPSSLDIEKRIYRPLIIGILPFVGALFARTIGSILPAAAASAYRAFVSFRNFWIEEHAKQEQDAAEAAQAERAPHTQGDLSQIAQAAQILNMRFSGDFMRVIFSSLAYSLLIFFIGFALIQIVVFTG